MTIYSANALLIYDNIPSMITAESFINTIKLRAQFMDFVVKLIQIPSFYFCIYSILMEINRIDESGQFVI